MERPGRRRHRAGRPSRFLRVFFGFSWLTPLRMRIDVRITPDRLRQKLARVFALADRKIRALHRTWDPARGAPVVTVGGRYTARGWTEWTQGFQFGQALLQFDATGEEFFLRLGRENTVRRMAAHVSHMGVHDHGFNIGSTYGQLRRLLREGRAPFDQAELNFCELALKVSGAVQAARHVTTAHREPWSPVGEPAVLVPAGYLYSFNGPHSLFADTIRSLRVLAVAHQLGQVLMSEGDRPVNLLHRAVEHATTTARFNVYFGAQRDAYDVRGRVAHESIFNRRDGCYRCPSSQQGWSPFTTWTRGAAWILCGYAELLEFLDVVPGEELDPLGGRRVVTDLLLATARAVGDYYLDGYAARDGVPYWDSGAPSLWRLGDYQRKPADPFNPWEPVDSSAAAIAAQGFVRLGRWLAANGSRAAGTRYFQAGLTIAAALFDEPYLSTSPAHQGLLLHSVYHRPNGWDHVPRGRTVPCGESSMWGDYHALELALLLQRLADGKYYTFF